MAYDFTITGDGPATAHFRDERPRTIARRVTMGTRVMVDLDRRRSRSRLLWKPTQYHKTWRWTPIDLTADATHQEIASEVISLIARRVKSSEQVTRARKKKAEKNKVRRPDKAVDFQRQRLYNAENTLPERHQLLAGGFAETVAFINHVISTAYWRRQPHHLMDIRVTQGRRHAGCRREETQARLAMPPSMRSQLVSLHELAHVLTPSSGTVAGHGPEFARAYIDLVEEFMGEDVARRLRSAFRRGNVKF